MAESSVPENRSENRSDDEGGPAESSITESGSANRSDDEGGPINGN